MYAWGHLCKDFMISVPHSKPKTGFKNSKRRQHPDVMTHDALLSCDSRDGGVSNNLKYQVPHSRMEVVYSFLLFMAILLFTSLLKQTGILGRVRGGKLQ